MAKTLDLEKALCRLGHWYNCSSKWHVALYSVVNATTIFVSFHMMAIVFVGMEPTTFHCKIPVGISPSEAIPPDPDNMEVLDHCSHYLNFSSATNFTVEGCPNGWFYSDERYGMAHEWDAVCGNAYKVSTSQTIMVAGCLVGALVVGPVMDRVGRKRVMLSSVVMVSVLAFCNGWVKHYWLFCVFRFCIGVMQQGITMASFIYQCELFSANERTVACTVSGISWCFGMFMLDLFAYLVRRWNHLMFTISLPGLLFIPLFWIIPESLPYLIAHGRLREAKEALQSAAKMNGVRLPPEYDLSPEDEKLLMSGVEVSEPPPSPARRRSSVANAVYAARRSSVAMATRRMSRAPLPPDGEVHTYTALDILKSKRLLVISLIVPYLWCTSALVYYGLSLNIGSLAGDPYINFFLSALVEIPAILIVTVSLNVVGRRWPLIIAHLIAGIPLLVLIFIPSTTAKGTNLKPLIVTLSMLGKFGITASFAIVYIHAPELFPTTIRGVGMGIASTGSRTGTLIAPLTPLVMTMVSWLPNAVFSTMAILGAVLSFFLPETLGRPLPQTIREVEQWNRNLTPEEKLKFKASKKADEDFNEMKLDSLMEKDEPTL